MVKERLRTVLRNSSWSALAQVGEKALRFLSIPLLLAAYGRENFGLIAIVLGICGFLSILSMGMPSGIVRFTAQWLHAHHFEALRRCCHTTLSCYSLLGVFNAALFIALALWGIGLFGIDPAQQPLLRNLLWICAGYALIFWPTRIIGQLLEGAEDIRFLQQCNVARAVLEFAWALAAINWNVGLDLYLAVRLTLTLLLVPLQAWRWLRSSPERAWFKLGWHWSEFRPMLNYSLGVFAIGFASSSFLELRPILLGTRAASIGAVTDFTVLAALVNVLLMAGTWVMRPLIPSTSKAMAAGDQEYLDFITFRATKYFWALILLPLVWLMMNGPHILRVYAGPQFVHLAPWLAVMACSAIDSYLSPVSGIIFASGKLRPYVWSNAIFSGVGLLVVWQGASLWGARAAVLGTLLYYACQLAYHHCYYFPCIMKIDSWRLFRTGFLRPILAAIGTSMALAGFLQLCPFGSPWITLAVSGIFAALIHGVMVYWFAFDSWDRASLGRWLQSFLQSRKLDRGPLCATVGKDDIHT